MGETATDPFDLSRFLYAQEGIYPQVLHELGRGRKSGHWIWYIFPQIAGLGRSTTSRLYSIASIDEASAYVAHPVLGPRLVECTELVLNVEGMTAAQIFGSLDAMKFRSSMTLFAASNAEIDVFDRALEKYFSGSPDPLTEQAIRHSG